MKFSNITKYIIEEQRAFDYQKVIADAIKNRRKISFYYYGPQRPKKISVKNGRRILVEPTTLGLTKKGNLAFKGWVQPPSVTKTGFEKHGWRTFLLPRIHRLELTNDTFDTKRPGYNDGDDSSFSKVMVKTDFDKKPRIYKYDQPQYARLGRPISKKPIEPELKPQIEPVAPEIEPKVPEVEPVAPETKPTAPETQPQITEPTKEPNVPADEPTKSTEDLPEPKEKTKPAFNPEDEDEDEENEKKELQEQINKIKSLMFKINIL